MEYRVGLFRCNNYDVDQILHVFRKAVALIGFDTTALRGKTVLLKPNMLGAYPPEMGITTPPAFLEAAIILFKGFGCTVWVGDSPNGIFPLDCVWERTGIREVCRRQGAIEKIFEREGSVVSDGILIAKTVFEADIIVNLPKFKTHGLTVLTAATKNLYGCVPGLQKTMYHRDAIDRAQFSKLVVRIAEIAKPALNLVDGIVAMEGTGPSAGRLIKMNTVISGTNHHAVDSICADLIGVDPLDIDTIAAAQSLGVWQSANKITIVGEDIETCRPPSFELPVTFTKGMRDWWISKFVINRIWGNISIKPRINKKRCKRCGLCVKACPVEAISSSSRLEAAELGCDNIPKDYKKIDPPHVINEKCVMCYCCHEICPYKAINLNESLGVRIGRFLGEKRITRLKNVKNG
jgi:uncharacterized protein (DUF362 family)/ferredoxin